jgi:hypothetical protein
MNNAESGEALRSFNHGQQTLVGALRRTIETSQSDTESALTMSVLD